MKDIQDEGDQSTQSQSHPEMGHPVIQRGHGHPVGEDTLEADEQQPSWEGHAGPHVVKRLGVIHLRHSSSQRGCGQKSDVSEGMLLHLEVSHHNQAQGVGAARDQSAGVDPTLVAVLNHLGIA